MMKFIKELREATRVTDPTLRELQVMKWINNWVRVVNATQGISSHLLVHDKEDFTRHLLRHGKHEFAHCMAKNDMMSIELNQHPHAVFSPPTLSVKG